MIISNNLDGLSPIFLSVLLIVYLLIIELGSEKIKKLLLPFVIVLIVVFAVIAGKSIFDTYSGVK